MRTELDEVEEATGRAPALDALEDRVAVLRRWRDDAGAMLDRVAMGHEPSPEDFRLWMRSHAAARALPAAERRLARMQEAERRSSAWDAEREAKAAAERRQAAEVEAIEEAGVWLAVRLDSGPVLQEELYRDGEEAGHRTGHLLAALGELGALRLKRYGSGGRVRNSDPLWWGLHASAGWARVD